MTFPLFRPLLADLDANPNVVALGVTVSNEPIGLLLAEINVEYKKVQVHSIYVAPTQRECGIATALLNVLEENVRGRGATHVAITYMRDKTYTPIVERLLAKLEYPPPQLRARIIRCSAESIARARWLAAAPLAPPFEIICWRDIADADRRSLEPYLAQHRLIPFDLNPFHHEKNFEPRTSLALRYQNELVGWMLNHETSRDTVRFTCGWVRRDMQNMGKQVPFVSLLGASIQCALRSGYQFGTWAVFARQKGMLALTQRLLEPYALSISETFGTEKLLNA